MAVVFGVANKRSIALVDRSGTARRRMKLAINLPERAPGAGGERSRPLSPRRRRLHVRR